MHRSSLLLAALQLVVSAPAFATISGTVVDADGEPIEGVRVRASKVPQGDFPESSAEFVTTGPDGAYSVETPPGTGQYLLIGFGKPGYTNTAGYLGSTASSLEPVELQALTPIDNVSYEWVKPYVRKDNNSDFGCNFCHGEQHAAWQDSQMANAARNPRVLSWYNGTDLDGASVDVGFRVDNPTEAGNCADCHAPAAAVDAPGATVLSEVAGVAQEGIFCDVCHKIRDVDLDAPPGVGGAVKIQRPSAWDGLFAFGPFDDAAGPMTTSYSELIKTSKVCAGCHEWVNEAGVPIMTTYSEWAQMSGAESDALQCQDCHMKKKFGPEYQGEDDGTAFILDDEHMQSMHGVRRQKSTIHPHEFHGGKEYAAEAAALSFETEQAQDGTLLVRVKVENVNAGHSIPTGMPFRHALLVVEATAGSQPLTQIGGPSVPDYGGEGDSELDLAGLPGKGYARVLGDDDGNRNVPSWRATREIEDTRLGPAAKETLSFTFQAPSLPAEVDVSARLIYRRQFRDMALKLKWDDEDILMAEQSERVSLEQVADSCAQAGARGAAAPLLLLGLLLLPLRARRRARLGGAVVTAGALLAGACIDLGTAAWDPQSPEPDDGAPGIGGDDIDCASRSGAEEAWVTLVSNTFQPKELTICAGDTVVWQNLDTKEHRIVSGTPDNPDGFLTTSTLYYDDTASFVFEAPMELEYYCSTHKKQMFGAKVFVR